MSIIESFVFSLLVNHRSVALRDPFSVVGGPFLIEIDFSS